MQGEQVLLRFAGGKTAVADIAIGSDGANSRLRELVTPIRPEYVGVSLVEMLVPAAKQTVPELWHLLGGSALIALGGERTIGMGTKPDGSVLLYAGLKTHDDTARQSLDEATSPDRRVAWFHANFEDGVSCGIRSSGKPFRWSGVRSLSAHQISIGSRSLPSR
jgi:2-polyprenyl-6-methoxyphenol hydroxylase-like FAD-dependent oxidoreductase